MSTSVISDLSATIEAVWSRLFTHLSLFSHLFELSKGENI